MKIRSRLSPEQLLAFFKPQVSTRKSSSGAVGDECASIITQNPRVYYDETLFRYVCDDLHLAHKAKMWTSILSPSLSTVEDMLMVIPNKLRPTILKHYVWKFSRMIII